MELKKYKVTIVFDRLNVKGVLEKDSVREYEFGTIYLKAGAKAEALKMFHADEPNRRKIKSVKVEESGV